MQALVRRADAPTRRSLRFFGPTESAVARVLDENGGEEEGFEATVCARDLEIHVDLVVRPGGEAVATRLTDALVDAFTADLFARDDERPVEEIVLDLCRQRGWTLATAESCTGGLIGARLTEVAGASDVFLGGVIAYSNEVKEKQLGVPNDLLREHGAVSAEVGAAMAAGAREALGADLAIADTGIAGPGGGTPQKPVGLVFLSVDGPWGAHDGALAAPWRPGDRQGAGDARWLCTHCGGELSRSTRRGLMNRALGWKAMSGSGSSAPCSCLPLRWTVSSRGRRPSSPRTAKAAPRLPEEPPRHARVSRRDARQLERGRWPRPCGRRVRAANARCSPWTATARRGAWR